MHADRRREPLTPRAPRATGLACDAVRGPRRPGRRRVGARPERPGRVRAEPSVEPARRPTAQALHGCLDIAVGQPAAHQQDQDEHRDQEELHRHEVLVPRPRHAVIDLDQHGVQQVHRVADQPEPGQGARHLLMAAQHGHREGQPGELERVERMADSDKALRLRRVVPLHGDQGEAEHQDRHVERASPGVLAGLGAVQHRAGEHQREDGEGLPGGHEAAVEDDDQQPGHRRQHGADDARPAPARQRQHQADQDQAVGDRDRHAGREQVVGQGPGHEEPAKTHRRRREHQGVPVAPPVHAAQEQRGEHQVEHHLVGQRPGHVGHRRRPQHALQHEHVGERGGHRVGVHTAQRADPAGPEHDHGAQREQVDRVQPEQAAHPETADAALALQRRGHDVAADEEEHEDAVLAGVEPVIDRIPDRLEHGIGQVVEHHAQRGDPAQCVQPGEPRPGPPSGADLRL